MQLDEKAKAFLQKAKSGGMPKEQAFAFLTQKGYELGGGAQEQDPAQGMEQPQEQDVLITPEQTTPIQQQVSQDIEQPAQVAQETPEETSVLDDIRQSVSMRDYLKSNPIARKIGLGVQGIAKAGAWLAPGIDAEDVDVIQPQTASERAIEKVGEYGAEAAQFAAGGAAAKGLGLLGKGVGKASKIATAVFAGSPAATQVITSAGGGALVGAVDPKSTAGKVALSVLGSSLTGAGSSVAKGIVNSVKKQIGKEAISSSGKEVANSMADSFARTGVKRTVGTLGGTGAQAESLLSKSLGGAPSIQRARAAQVEALDKFFQKTVDGLSLKSTTDDVVDAGKRAVLKGKEEFSRQSGKLYDALDVFVPPNSQVKMSNVKNVVDDIIKEKSALSGISGELADDAISPFIKKLKDMKDVGTPKGIRALRGMVAEQKNMAMFEGKSGGDLKKLYGALSKDLKQAYSGDEITKKAYEKADEFYSSFQKNVTPIFEKIHKSDKASTILGTTFAKEAKPTAELRKWLPKSEYDTLLSVKLRQMGVDPQGQFNPMKFMKEYNKIPDNVKNVMLKGTEYSGVRDSLDDFMKVAENLASRKVFENPSGTAGQIMQMSQGGLVGAGLMSGAGIPAAMMAIGGPYVAAKLATSPAALKVLSEVTKRAGNVAAKTGVGFTTAFRNEILKNSFKSSDKKANEIIQEYKEGALGEFGNLDKDNDLGEFGDL